MKTKVLDVFIKIFSLMLVISLVVAFPFGLGKAYASVSNSDKLYGETLTQREMKVSDCPSVSAKYACLMSKDGTLIYERDAYTHAKIASMTKIMTAIVTLENASLNETLTINQKAVDIGESSAGFWVGDEVTVDAALYALMVPSGNDAAEALCEYVGQKAVDAKDARLKKMSDEEIQSKAEELDVEENDVPDAYITDKDEAFVALMNAKAKEIGCSNSSFTNPHGLDDDEFQSDNQYSCAADMAQITRYAMQNDKFRSIVGGGSTTITVKRNNKDVTLALKSTDILLTQFEGCLGVKTGVTDEAGACFSGAVKDSSNVEIYTIVMHSENEATRFVDTQDLWNWYYTNKIDYQIANSDTKMDVSFNGQDQTADIIGYVGDTDWCTSTIPVCLTNNNQTVPILKVAGNVYQSIEPIKTSGDIKAGEVVAKLIFKQHNAVTASVDLVAAKDCPAPNIFQMIGVSLDRLTKMITGQPTTAETTIINNTRTINN